MADVKLDRMPRNPGIFKRTGVRGATYVATLWDGKKQLKKSFATLSAAKTWRTQKQQELTSGTYVEPSKLTVGQLLQQVLDAGMPEIEESSTVAYSDRMKQLRTLHDIPVQQLDLATLVAWQTKALSRDGTRKPYAKATVSAALHFLGKALRYAVAHQILVRNPMDELEVVAGKPRRDNVLGSAELAKLRAAWSDHKDRVLWEFIAETGARVGEACVAEIRDIDLETGIWQMRRRRQTALSRQKVTRDGAKSDAGMRPVRLSADMVALLRQHIQSLQDRKKFEPDFNPGNVLFPAPRAEGAMRYQTARLQLVALCDKAGIKRISPHGLRHTSATLLMAAGVNAKIVSERIGHSDVATTLRRYVHPDADEHEKAVERLVERMKSG